MDSINKRELVSKLYTSRVRILSSHPFFGVVILNLKFAFSDQDKTISTDGETIYINPTFLNNLKDEEVDIAIIHEVMHIILKHPFRFKDTMNNNFFHLACDIVVNSNIMQSLSSPRELTINGRILPHKAPNGKEGYLYSAEEVYQMFLSKGISNNAKDSEKCEQNQDEISQQIDSYEHGDLPQNTVVVMKSNSNYNGKLYLRCYSCSDYVLGSGWDEKVIVYNNFIDNPLIFTSDKIYSLFSKDVCNCSIELKSDFPFEEIPVPQYQLDKFNLLMDDTGSIKHNSNKKYSFTFINKVFSQELFNSLVNVSYTNSKFVKEEKDYRKFVYQNYLSMPKVIKKYFEKIVLDNSFSKDDNNTIVKIRNYIATRCKYSITYPQPNPGDEPILFFMEQSKAGKCTHFASAAALLYRAVGIPSRFVLGYNYQSKANKSVDVYLEEGHAWVEVYIDNVGWVLIDPTPNIYSSSVGNGNDNSDLNNESELDNHDRWKDANKGQLKDDEINKMLMEAHDLHNKSKSAGNIPGSIEVMINSLKKPQIDWRVLLNEFIQENIVDYSFCPPDKRFSDSDFVLPDFNEPEDVVSNVLFMVDVSGSMEDDDIKTCFSEIQGAISQFNGKMQGYVGFFDTKVSKVQEFDGDTNILDIKPVGRGGTDFHSVFKYVKENMSENLPNTIIILSDGFAPFPCQKEAMNIPVMWIFNNNESDTPSFGKTIRIHN